MIAQNELPAHTTSSIESWCASEKSTCPSICQDQAQTGATVNSCDAVCLQPPHSVPEHRETLREVLAVFSNTDNAPSTQDTLSYGCLCGDGTQPNVSEYSLTLPYFVCTEWGSQCVSACGDNNTCSAACRDDHPCGALHPSTSNATATASASSASDTADSTAIYSGPAGQTGSSGAPGRALPSIEVARLYGTAGMLGLFSLGFAYLL